MRLLRDTYTPAHPETWAAYHAGIEAERRRWQGLMARLLSLWSQESP